MGFQIPPEEWSLGSRVRYIRTQWGLTQREIQARGGPSRMTLIRLEQGRGDVESTFRSTVDSLSKVLGCRAEWLLTGTGPIWADGICPPDDLRVGTAMPKAMGKDLPRYFPDRASEIGRWVTEGPIDWAIVARAVRLLDDSIRADPRVLTRAVFPFSVPLALQLLYAHLAQQVDPMIHTDPDAVRTILEVSAK